jgi:hypothetical protein
MLFDKEYSFKGEHARKVDDLTSTIEEAGTELFKRVIDVYLLAPLVGYIYSRKSDPDKSIEFTKKIFLDPLIREKRKLEFNYRLILLLDDNYSPNNETKINKAFRNYGNGSDETLEDEQIYERYVLGGIDVLHEKLIQSSTTPDDYIYNLYDFLMEFRKKYEQAVNTSTNEIFQKLKIV